MAYVLNKIDAQQTDALDKLGRYLGLARIADVSPLRVEQVERPQGKAVLLSPACRALEGGEVDDAVCGSKAFTPQGAKPQHG